MDEVTRQIQSHVDVYGDDFTVSWNNAKHNNSGMIAADVIVPALGEDVARPGSARRAEDPGVGAAWSTQVEPNPTAQSSFNACRTRGWDEEACEVLAVDMTE